MSDIREVESTESATRVAEFFRSIWQDGDDVAPLDLILANQHVGGYCAFVEVSGVIQAASFAFRGVNSGNAILHSHVTASKVAGLGYDLKMHQWNWAKQSHLDAITWTFDPLVRRNAVFNFAKLGAIAIEYLPNFYGAMGDSINHGDQSDRLFVYWPVAAEPSLTAKGEALWVELPEDIESMRRADLDSALEWRMRLRGQLEPLFDGGAVIRSVNTERTAILVEKVNK